MGKWAKGHESAPFYGNLHQRCGHRIQKGMAKDETGKIAGIVRSCAEQMDPVFW